MNTLAIIRKIGLATAASLLLACAAFAQTDTPKPEEKTAKAEQSKEQKEGKIVPVPGPTPPQETLTTDEAEVITYYNNYLKEYRLGPNDIISVEVFGQCPDYCKGGITVPPTARISYPLIREGVLVGGRTVEEVAAEITKKLDEYIIEPKVTVTLEKAMSARYSVMGKVAAPGVRVMDRKVSLYEAVIEAGGVLKTGDRKKIALIRFDNEGRLARTEVNLAEIESGKAPMIFLNPGDQVFVPGKGFQLNFETLMKGLERVSVVRFLFGSPF